VSDDTRSTRATPIFLSLFSFNEKKVHGTASDLRLTNCSMNSRPVRRIANIHESCGKAEQRQLAGRWHLKFIRPDVARTRSSRYIHRMAFLHTLMIFSDTVRVAATLSVLSTISSASVTVLHLVSSSVDL